MNKPSKSWNHLFWSGFSKFKQWIKRILVVLVSIIVFLAISFDSQPVSIKQCPQIASMAQTPRKVEPFRPENKAVPPFVRVIYLNPSIVEDNMFDIVGSD